MSKRGRIRAMMHVILQDNGFREQPPRSGAYAHPRLPAFAVIEGTANRRRPVTARVFVNETLVAEADQPDRLRYLFDRGVI
jgi:hypothetical protein